MLTARVGTASRTGQQSLLVLLPQPDARQGPLVGQAPEIFYDPTPRYKVGED